MKRVNVKDLKPDPDGDARRFAEIIAARKCPGLNTDTERFKGVAAGHHIWDDIHPTCRDFYRQKAEAAGVSIHGKKYLSSLASEPGDPRAWVDSTGDIRSVCEERGYGCEGMVTVKAREAEQPDDEGPYRVAECHVTEKFNEIIESNPEVAPTPREQADLKENLRTRLSGTQD